MHSIGHLQYPTQELAIRVTTLTQARRKAGRQAGRQARRQAGKQAGRQAGR